MRYAQRQGDDSSGRPIISPDRSAVLPPLALAAVVLLTGAPVFASASGLNSHTGNFPGIIDADGFYYNIQAPDPNVGTGVRTLTHNRAYVNRPSYHFNGVGFYSWDSRSNRRLAYQVSDSSGNYIYTLSSPIYQPYNSSGGINNVSAGMWRTNGQWWHFNWWGPDFNVGVNVYNSSGANNVTETSMGPDGWGGCPSSYDIRIASSWLYRNKWNGSWYYFPSTNSYAWGNTPTWWISGSGANGGSFSFGTVSCP